MCVCVCVSERERERDRERERERETRTGLSFDITAGLPFDVTAAGTASVLITAVIVRSGCCECVAETCV